MNVLVINAGSSSLKYQLLNPETEQVLAKGLCEIPGVELVYTGEFFHEFVTTLPKAEEVLAALEKADILGGLPVEGGILWCATELNTKEKIDVLADAIKEVL